MSEEPERTSPWVDNELPTVIEPTTTEDIEQSGYVPFVDDKTTWTDDYVFAVQQTGGWIIKITTLIGGFLLIALLRFSPETKANMATTLIGFGLGQGSAAAAQYASRKQSKP